ncbi:MAG TPA: DUF6508 domain-containing protein [Aridibacter sp.]|nr:DUF6508 domain-containing protein [Aridibacter sp.]
MPRTSETHPIRVDFLEVPRFPMLNNLGMTFAPGKKQRDAMSGPWHRDLRTDLKRLRGRYQTTTLVSLIEEHELRELQIGGLFEMCLNEGIVLIRFPIKDVSLPSSPEQFYRLTDKLADRLREKKRIAVHCKGGLGRTGMTAACIVVAAAGGSIKGDEAIRIVRQARKGMVETAEQESFIRSYEEGKKYEEFARPYPTARDADELTGYLPRLYAEGFVHTPRWFGGETRPDGSMTVPYPEYDPLVLEFFGKAAKDCWRDYVYTSSSAPWMAEDKRFIASAGVDDIRTLLTGAVRGERFGDGHWESLIKSGTIKAILERLKDLKEEGAFSR